MSKRQLAMLFFCSLISWSFGYGAVPLLPVYAASLGASSATAGYYLATVYVAIAVGSASASWVAKVFHSQKRPLILAGLTGVPLSWWIGHATSLWSLTVATAVMWFFGGLGLALISILAGLSAGEDERGRVFGVLSLTYGIGSIVGGLGMGAIAEQWGYRVLFSVTAGYLLLWPLLSIFLTEPKVEAEPEVEPGAAPDRPVAARAPLGGGYYVFLAASLLAAIATFVFTLGRSLLMNDLALGALAISTTNALAGVVAIPLPLILGSLSDRTGRRRYLAMSYAMLVVALAILMRSTRFWQFLLASGASTIFAGVVSGMGQALVTDLVPRPSLSKALSWLGAIGWIGGIVGFASTGIALERLGTTTTLALGMTLAAAAILLLIPVRRSPSAAPVVSEEAVSPAPR